MSFVDLMADDVWSESDIVARTEAMIAADFPREQEAIINRIVTAAAAGLYQLTEDEQAQVMRYNEVCLAARGAGVEARADMGLLNRVLAHEVAPAGDADQDVLDLVAARAAARQPLIGTETTFTTEEQA